jgi:arginine N-succinyltransferase
VYVNLLPESARAVIGEVHDDTRPARTLLEQEGFRYEGYVDIFDAGPTLECFRDNIHAVRQSVVLPVAIATAKSQSLDDTVVWLVANRRFDDFRATLVQAPARVEHFPLAPEAARELGVADGDTVRAVALSPKDR